MMRRAVYALSAGLLAATAFVLVRRPSFLLHLGRPDVLIVISIDTLRADHLGCYGYVRETSPNIDRFSRDSVLFETAIAQAPSTEPSHASIFSSLIPTRHGAFFSRQQPLPAGVETMAEILKKNGLQTMSVNDGGQIASELGFDQGFDLYWSLNVADFSKTVALATSLLAISKRPAFMFLHTLAVHHPYKPSAQYLQLFDGNYGGHLPSEISFGLLEGIKEGRIHIDDEDRAHIVAAYDGSVRLMDSAFGMLLDQLREQGLYDRSLMVFTSDHGEELGDHGVMGWHSHTLYDELLRVPLIIKFPESQYAGRRISEQVRSIDILPTILEVLGIPLLPVFEGSSLMDLVSGRGVEERAAVSEMDAPSERRPVAVRTEGWKLYREAMGRKVLFDLRSDPGETKDASAEHPDVRRTLEAVLKQRLAGRAIPNQNQEKELSEDLKRQLRALGYVQ